MKLIKFECECGLIILITNSNAIIINTHINKIIIIILFYTNK